MIKEHIFTADSTSIAITKKNKGIDINLISNPPYNRVVKINLDTDTLNELYSTLKSFANDLWPNHTLHDVTGFGNDYTEYYDKETDNDGGLSISKDAIIFYPPGYHLDSPKLYRFTKRTIETFLFDLEKHTTKIYTEEQ